MEHLFPVPINYLVFLFVEIMIFSTFAYFVFFKTTGEVCRRWKVSIFVAVTFGVVTQTFFIGLGWIGWLMKLNLATIGKDLIEYLNILMPASLGTASLITMPIIILGTFIVYYQLLNSGDCLIEKYWRNPKVHYGSNQKPPFRTF